jgi:hypothetical protein
MLTISKTLVNRILKYIHEEEVMKDGEYGNSRSIKQLIVKGKMPDIYYKLKKIKQHK